MIRLKTKKMMALLKEGIRKAEKMKIPSKEGTFIPLFTETLKNGWHYQIDFVFDRRIYNNPFVEVNAFKPPLRWCARSTADYYLNKELLK